MNRRPENLSLDLPQGNSLLQASAALRDSNDPELFLAYLQLLKANAFDATLWTSFLKRVSGSVRYTSGDLYFDTGSASCKKLLMAIVEFVKTEPLLAAAIQESEPMRVALSNISAALATPVLTLPPVTPKFHSERGYEQDARWALPEGSLTPHVAGWYACSPGFDTDAPFSCLVQPGTMKRYGKK